jgi:hypothetical protein
MKAANCYIAGNSSKEPALHTMSRKGPEATAGNEVLKWAQWGEGQMAEMAQYRTGTGRCHEAW